MAEAHNGADAFLSIETIDPKSREDLQNVTLSPISVVHLFRQYFFELDETQIEASFCEAIRIAREQKSVSLEKRAKGSYAEYRRQKASGSEGRGFRLPLW